MIKKYLLYLFRWQLSTPLLAVVLYLLSDVNITVATIIANFIGGLIFFWVDKFIFLNYSKFPLWEIKENVKCFDCGKIEEGYRIVEWLKYNKKNDKMPQYRCKDCRKEKYKKVKQYI